MTTDTHRPAFYVSHEAWYWDAVSSHHRDPAPEIMIGYYPEGDGGCVYEFAIRWLDLREGRDQLSPRVEIFHDAWDAFTDPTMGTLFTWLSQHGGKPQPDEVKVALLELGFVDRTPREHKD